MNNLDKVPVTNEQKSNTEAAKKSESNSSYVKSAVTYSNWILGRFMSTK